MGFGLVNPSLEFWYSAALSGRKKTLLFITNGVGDHVHILCIMSKNIPLAKLVEEIKRYSIRWIKTKNPYYKTFAWQGGYGTFSVSPSVLDKTIKYIEKQEEHHKKTGHQRRTNLIFLKNTKWNITKSICCRVNNKTTFV
jgi:putative transposase